MNEVKLFDINEDEWEIINDGFVYKRKKCRICPTSMEPPPPDPAIAEKNRRERKKNTLIKLKEKYYREISQWEILSNTFKTMQLKAKSILEARQDHAPPTLCHDRHSCDCAREWFGGEVLDEVLGQVEAEEAIIQDISKLSNISNALFKAEEEKLKQSLIELPIWDY